MIAFTVESDKVICLVVFTFRTVKHFGPDHPSLLTDLKGRYTFRYSIPALG
ncbi:MAG TPA: hypothetical protein PLC76_08880 [Saprospiraceae bacterium]|nr:hypothetical protein [Saprospiraceae bacterium]QLH28531.1 MAG: hypothetical protein HWD63_03470 [Candidatus Parvibacillus calidus]HRN33374.1 hypothetical protein [Saprospiraceae bacterium]HRP84827.1 hypothetical protein [Saprospiraceae bacterium]